MFDYLQLLSKNNITNQNEGFTKEIEADNVVLDIPL
ncbi:hypothetical protein SAMN04487777_1284 [Priestia aryabhattai B8W22]|nr:hypothetical protein SAMN04487777_1284 [Priestia aryabhattai B8W22]